MATPVPVCNQPGRIFRRCVEARLTEHRIVLRARTIAEDPAATQDLVPFRVATTPTVLGDRRVVGFDRKRLAALLGLEEV